MDKIWRLKACAPDQPVGGSGVRQGGLFCRRDIDLASLFLELFGHGGHAGLGVLFTAACGDERIGGLVLLRGEFVLLRPSVPSVRRLQ